MNQRTQRTQLAVHGGGAMTALPSGWDLMMQQASVLVRSGFLPDSIKTAEQAVAIVLTGEELGIPKMLALRSINIIKGKPTLSADLMASLIHRAIDAHGDGLFDVQPPTPQSCTVRFRRWGKKETKEFTFTIEDAQRAGLTNNANYKLHPGAMLRARATSNAARMEFPDVINGLYTPDEISEHDVESWQADQAQTGFPENPDPDVATVPPIVAEAVNQDTGEINEQGWRQVLMRCKDELEITTVQFNTLRRELKLPLLERMEVSQMRQLYAAMLNLVQSAAEEAGEGDWEGERLVEAEFAVAGEPGLDAFTAR